MMLILGLITMPMGCSGDPEVVYVFVETGPETTASSGQSDASGALTTDADEEGAVSSESADGGTSEGGPTIVDDAGRASDASSGEEGTSDTVDDAPDVGPVTVPEEGDGIADSDGIVLHPDSLDGLWYFGLGVEPSTPLGTIGNTAVGIILMPSIVELVDGVMTIRAFDTESFAPVEGSDGVIEQYAYEAWGDGGEVRLDFSKPLTSLEVAFWQGCTYAMDTYLAYGAPAFTDGLMTWSALEIYESQNCGNQGFPMSAGVNVHFLRRQEANPDFTPRAVDEASPFGFFTASWGETEYMTRLPGVGGGAPDGQVTYYVTTDFPDDIRHVVDQVFEAWNDVLQEAAGNRPFVVEDAPNWMVPWDPRYRVVYWDDSKSQGAIAPFIEDPFTGEMIDTDVIVWLGDMTDLIARYQEFFADNPEVEDWVDASAAEGIEMVHPATLSPAEIFNDASLPPRVLRRRPFVRRPLHPAQIGQLFERYGMSLDEQSIRELIIADFLVHEVGHNLGLRHNFEASTDHPNFQNFEGAIATSTSTMDYVVGMTIPGSYDADAMRHGYGDGALKDSYRFCTDEDVNVVGACARWDFGSPGPFFLEVMDGLAADYPPDTNTNQLANAAAEQEWSLFLNRIRQLVNSDVEPWGDEAPFSVFQAMLDRVVCDVPCEQHLWFRNQYALYLLYSKHVVVDVWYDFPVLSEAQRATLFTTYEVLLLDPEQPEDLQQTIVGKLPTSAVEGAEAFLDGLQATLQALEAPSEHESWLLGIVNEAKG
jgi:hypothetical protein